MSSAPPTGTDAETAALLLLQQRIAQLSGGEAAGGWSLSQLRELLRLVEQQKGVVDDADVCLLGDVKAKFRAAGISRLSAREKAVEAMQELLWPKPVPKAEDPAELSKEFLRAAQSGALLEARQMLASRPSLLNARSSSKGYTAMHFAAMAGATPVLEWLAAQGLAPDVVSLPADQSAGVTPLQVAAEYKREGAMSKLKLLQEAHTFLKTTTGADNEEKLRAAARSGSLATASVLLRNDPGLAQRPSVAGPRGSLVIAAQAGHTEVVRELVRYGALHVESCDGGPSALQAAVAGRHGETANLLHEVERSLAQLQLGHWSQPLSRPETQPPQPPLCALVLDTKLSRGRCCVLDAWEPLLCSTSGSPNLEDSFFRWIEERIGLPIWVPVSMQLYEQFHQGVRSAVDSLASAEQRELLLHLTTSKADALHRLKELMLVARVPQDLASQCAQGLTALIGRETFEAHWSRLTPKMREWIARLTYFMPGCPWSRQGGFISRSDTGQPDEAEQLQLLELQLCVLELLAKARLLFCLFSDDGEERKRASKSNSVLPFQPDASEETFPWPRKPDHNPSDARSYAAALLLFSPVDAEFVRAKFPQALLLNGAGLVADVREKAANRLALRLCLAGSASTTLNPKWTALPMVYSPSLALAALSRLGGPRNVLIRHPLAFASASRGGGELAVASEDLDAALKVLLGAPGDAEKRVKAMVDDSRFFPDGDPCTGVLLVEELVPGAALPQDGKKGWFDPTQRAYCIQALSSDAPASAAASADATDELRQVDAEATQGRGNAQTAKPPPHLSSRGGVIGGCCRFPPQPLAATATASCQLQHLPKPPYEAVALGAEMATGAFASRLPVHEVFELLHSLPLRHMVSQCLSSDSPVLHLCALSFFAGCTGGVRRLEYDPESLHSVQNEHLGKPIAANASVWDEHHPLLYKLVQPQYATRHGAPVAKLVQQRVLLDVIAKDFAAVASNALRQPDPQVVRLHLALERSTFDAVRTTARDLRAAFTSMLDTEEQMQDVPLANVQHMQDLVDFFDEAQLKQ